MKRFLKERHNVQEDFIQLFPFQGCMFASPRGIMVFEMYQDSYLLFHIFFLIDIIKYIF